MEKFDKLPAKKESLKLLGELLDPLQPLFINFSSTAEGPLSMQLSANL